MNDKIKKLQQKAAKLYTINEQIKVLTEEADKIKGFLRLELPKGGVEFKSKIGKVSQKILCDKIVQSSPVLNNTVLYGKLTYEEIVMVTKPVLSDLKKIIPDTYDELIEEATINHKDIECIKFKKIG